MASNSGKPARPSAAPTATTKPTGLPRQGLVAIVLLPVLLAAGFFLGSQLTGGGDAADAPTAIGASSEPSDVATDAPVGPELPSEEPTPAATTEAPATEAPASEEPSAAATSEAPSAAPTTEAPATQAPATEAPATEPPAPVETSEAPAPTQSPAPAETPAAPAPSDSPTVTTAAPAPTAGDSVLLFRGFAGEDVRTWQARMVERGWDLEVDGIYGPQTESVAERFQAEKGLAVDGIVGVATWNAAWTAPVT